MLEPERLTSYLTGLSDRQLGGLLVMLDRTNQGHSMFRGVAHDLSNASQALSMGVPAVQTGDIELEKWIAIARWVDEKMNRAAAVVRDFGTHGEDEERPVLVQDVLGVTHDWQQLQRAQPVGQIRWDASPDLRPVRVSDRRLRQVLLALIANAKEAVGEQREGTISIEATPSDNGVTIAVLDSGTGIDSAIKDKIFDAFFSTKNPDLHVGLGLTVARYSVESWGGNIEIDENEDGGTRVCLSLPYWSKPNRD
jgi:C4-dicarboxylate-specific signal transduction histidine kinase